MKSLNIGDIVVQGISLGLKKIVSLLGNIILWILTIWIPYINLGTTIGIIGLVAKMARGETFGITEIFNPKYRQYIGEFFLVMLLWYMGIMFGFAFFIVPAFVIGLAWSLAPILVIDRGINPMEALKKSNELTYGNKWKIFWGYFLLVLAFVILGGLVAYVGISISTAAGYAFEIVAYLLLWASLLGANAYVYESLVQQIK